jgi:hypothetical protein
MLTDNGSSFRISINMKNELFTNVIHTQSPVNIWSINDIVLDNISLTNIEKSIIVDHLNLIVDIILN